LMATSWLVLAPGPAAATAASVAAITARAAIAVSLVLIAPPRVERQRPGQRGGRGWGEPEDRL